MPEYLRQPFETKIGTATIGVAFMISSLFMAVPNRTLMYQAMEQGGVVGLTGFGLFLGGALTFYGSILPRRSIRHLGQCVAFMMGWWTTLNATVFDVIPATPIILGTLGTGLLVIWVRDAFAGVKHRKYARRRNDYAAVAG